jgi:hypothetical protein
MVTRQARNRASATLPITSIGTTACSNSAFATRARNEAMDAASLRVPLDKSAARAVAPTKGKNGSRTMMHIARNAAVTCSIIKNVPTSLFESCKFCTNPAQVLHKSCAGPTQDLLKSYSSPTQVLLRSYSGPAHVRRRSFSRPTHVRRRSYSSPAQVLLNPIQVMTFCTCDHFLLTPAT